MRTGGTPGFIIVRWKLLTLRYLELNLIVDIIVDYRRYFGAMVSTIIGGNRRYNLRFYLQLGAPSAAERSQLCALISTAMSKKDLSTIDIMYTL